MSILVLYKASSLPVASNMSVVGNGDLIEQLKALGINEKTAKYALSVSVGNQGVISAFVANALYRANAAETGIRRGAGTLTGLRKTTTM